LWLHPARSSAPVSSRQRYLWLMRGKGEGDYRLMAELRQLRAMVPAAGDFRGLRMRL
jgi:hypothetical protein